MRVADLLGAAHRLLKFEAVNHCLHGGIGMIVRKRLAKLLQGPLRRWVGSHILVENSSCSQFHNHEYIQSAKGGRYHDEKVARHDHLAMVMDERQPTLLWIGLRPGPPLCKYFSTVRGETLMPSLSCNSLAMRSSPQSDSPRPSPGSGAEYIWARAVSPSVSTANAKRAGSLCGANG